MRASEIGLFVVHAGDRAGPKVLAVHDGGVELMLGIGVENGALPRVEVRVVLQHPDSRLHGVQTRPPLGKEGGPSPQGLLQSAAEILLLFRGQAAPRHRPSATVHGQNDAADGGAPAATGAGSPGGSGAPAVDPASPMAMPGLRAAAMIRVRRDSEESMGPTPRRGTASSPRPSSSWWVEPPRRTTSRRPWSSVTRVRPRQARAAPPPRADEGRR